MNHQIDELGEMREGLAAGVLLSQDFTKIDQHLWAAFSCGLEMHPQLQIFKDYLTPPLPPNDEEVDGYEEMKHFCFQQMKKSRDTSNLVVKKFALLVCICLLEMKRERELFTLLIEFSALSCRRSTLTLALHRRLHPNDSFCWNPF